MPHIADPLSAAAASSLATSWADFTINTVGFSFRNGQADPRDYLAHDTLKDGTEVTVRAIRPEDSAGILGAFKELDSESIYRRFFSPKKELSDAELKQLTEVDFSQVSALVVTTQRDGA
jgi:hypothetical protein